MPSQLSVALIGVSHWHAPRYLEALQETKARLNAVSDPDLAFARQVADRWDCQAYSSHLQLLEATRPDLVFAMPRHCDAAEVAKDLLEAGLPVVFEKPMGLNAAQVAPLVELAARKQSFFAVPLILRYGPLWENLTGVLEQNGRAVYADFRLVNGPAVRYERAHSGWMLDPWLSGGGPMRNLGIHAADAVLRLTQTTVAELEVVGARLTFPANRSGRAGSARRAGDINAAVLPDQANDGPGCGIEDHAVALIAAPHGLLATIEAGYTYPSLTAGMGPGGDSEWRVVAGDSYLIDRDGQCTVIGPHGQQSEASPSGAERYRRFVLETMAGFQRDLPPLATVADCYQAMRLIDAIYEHACAPWLDL